jgi:PAS domain S-box-containing protein
MNESRSPLIFAGDARLSPYAISENPAWLWSADATRVLWCNPTAAAIFNAASPADLIGHTIDPRGSAALQIARLAGTLPHGATPRLERLRGFGGRMGGALLCGCSRIALADRTPAILVVAAEAAGPRLSLSERARRLLIGCDEPVALFSTDGALLHATPAAQTRLGHTATLTAIGAAALAAVALAAGRAEGDNTIGRISLERIGSGPSTVLLATLASPTAEIAATTAVSAPAVPEPHSAEAAPPSPPATEAAAPIETASAEPDASAEPLSIPPGPASASEPPPAPAEPPPPAAPPSAERRQPLRFIWQMDIDGRFTVDSAEFVALLGSRTAAALGKPWSEIATELALDPDGQVARAFASRDTWSGITVVFPADGADMRLAVELSGLPVFDRDRSFRGYRGFGICRDMARIDELLQSRRGGPRMPPRVEPPVFREEPPPVERASENVVPFRPSTPPEESPTLTPVERRAFSELASRLSERLRGRDKPEQPEAASPEPTPPDTAGPSPPIAPSLRPELRAPTADQRPILDRLPIGVLVYRLDKLIYGNRAFLDWTGYESLHALEQAGGLDALFVEPSGNDLAANNGTRALSIATNRGDQLPVDARLFTSPWDGESALVLMLTGVGGGNGREKSLEAALRQARVEAGELRTILDTATDGVAMLDREGRVIAINRGAETLFGYDSAELAGTAFKNLFAPESQAVASELMNAPHQPGAASVLNNGREVIGRRREGGLVPLFMTLGRIANGSDKFCAIFRDITLWKKTEGELIAARRQAEKASSAKSDFLAKISHEIRTPLNAIIGFAEVMKQERFGPVGNDRYKQYLDDIHASGSHVVSLLNDLLDLSKIEAGKLELNFAPVDLNELTQQCVALMQPQANRERIVIRTSLAPELPAVTADARSVRQIVLNLLSNSVKFTGAGGQVIVSTALDDGGDVVLRVRDTGVGMSEQDLAIALEPFRQLATSGRWGSGGSGLGLPLTKALAEANRASFRIRSGVNRGTLVEVAFPVPRLAAE